jgi:hypothetical protein
VETLSHALKQLYGRLCIVAKRRKVAKLVLAASALIFLCTILSGLIIANVKSVYQTSSTISSFGTLKAVGIEVYWNEDLTDKVTQINWGLLVPGGQKTYTIYVSNEGNVPVTLQFSTANWSPSSASNYLTLNWKYVDGQTIGAGDSGQVTLTLAVSRSITGISSFNFDLTAEGSV